MLSWSAKKICFAALVFFMFSVSVFSASSNDSSKVRKADDKNVKRKVIRPERSKPLEKTGTGNINIQDYFDMDDPAKAAEALLRFARDNKVDLNYVRPFDSPGKGSQIEHNPFRIRLLGADFVPGENEIGDFVAQKVDGYISSGQGDKRLVCILQSNRNLSLNEYIFLFKKNIRFYLSYTPFTFLVRMPAKEVQGVIDLPYIKWIGEHKSTYKFSQEPELSSIPGAFIVSLEGDRREFRESLERLGIHVKHFCRDTGAYYVTAEWEQFAGIAEFWWVKLVYKDQVKVPKNVSDESDRNKLDKPIDVHFEIEDSRLLINAWEIPDYYGASITLGVNDGGCYCNHENIDPVVECYTNNTDPHGTHVSGIAMDEVYGVARDAGLFFVGFDSEHDDTVLSFFVANDIRISNHSYDYPGVDEYTSYTRRYDAITYNDDHFVITAQGNYPIDQTPTNVACGKNVLAVGAVTYVTQNDLLPYEEIGGYPDYSVAGPTINTTQGYENMHRLKPDIVAPGGGDDYKYGIVSCRSETSNEGELWDSLYTRFSGTSMAAPHVSGAAALVADWYEDTYSGDIPSVLLKALLINTATLIKDNRREFGDDTEDDELRAFVNTRVGYGLVNPYSCIYGSDEFERLLFVEEEYISLDGLDPYQFMIPTDSPFPPEKVFITLAYNDDVAEGIPMDQLVDNLELEVMGPPIGFYETVLADWVTIESPIEKIMIKDPVPGQWYTVYVSFTGSEKAAPRTQKYALVADVIYGQPELEVQDVPDTIFTTTNTVGIDIPVTVRNIGSYIASGITVCCTSDYFFGGDCNEDPVYYRNLYYHGDYFETTLHLDGYPSEGIYTVAVKVDGANIEFAYDNEYPKTKDVTIVVEESTWKISGQIDTPLGGVAGGAYLNVTPGDDVYTEQDGTYEILVPEGWDGTIAPEYVGHTYTFTPPSRSYSNVIEDRPNQNFTMNVPQYSISGTIIQGGNQSVEGIILEAMPEGTTFGARNDTVDGDGGYVVSVEETWSGKVAPQMTDYYNDFSPPFYSYNEVMYNYQGKNYTAYHISWGNDGVAVCTDLEIQESPQITLDNNGGAIVVWSDRRNGLYQYDIYVQRVDIKGNALWMEDGVPVCSAASNQIRPRIIPDGVGGAIIAWEDHRTSHLGDIYAQRIDANGNSMWTPDGVEVCIIGCWDWWPKIIPDGEGGAIIVWQGEHDGSVCDELDVYAQRLDENGNPLWAIGGVTVSNAEDTQSQPYIAPDGSGGAVIVWPDYRNEHTRTDIYAQRINSAGEAQWTSNGVAVYTGPGYSRHPKITSDGTGGAIITWYELVGSESDIYAQRVDATGNLLWAPNGLLICSANGNQYHPKITSDGNGGAIIAWHDNRNGNYDIYAQKVSADSDFLWATDGIGLCLAAGNQEYPILFSDGMGGVFTTWWDERNGNRDIYAHWIDTNGSAKWETDGNSICSADGKQDLPQLFNDGSGGVLFTWEDERNGNKDIYATKKVYSGPRVLSPSGGEIWAVGSYQTIEWDIIGDTENIDHFELFYSYGSGFELIDDNVDRLSRQYTWRIPETPSTNCMVKVSAKYVNGQEHFDVSTEDFTIYFGIILVKPNGGEHWGIGTEKIIEWDVLEGSIGFDYFEVGYYCGSNYYPLATCDQSDRTYLWDIQVNACSECIVKVAAYDIGGEIFYGLSEEYFTIYHLPGEWGPDGLAICPTPENQERVSIISDGGGGAILTWTDSRTGAPGIYAHRIDPEGEFVWANCNLCSYSSAQKDPKIALTGVGEYTIAWRDCRNGNYYGDVYAQKIDLSGNLHWGSEGVPICTNVNDQRYTDLVLDGSGGTVIMWVEYPPGGMLDVPGTSYAQRFDSDGNSLWAEAVRICSGGSRMIADDAGGAIFTWNNLSFLVPEEDAQVWVQRIDEDGNLLWGSEGLLICPPSYTGLFLSSIAQDGEGGAFVVWTDLRSGNRDIYAQRVDSNGNKLWDSLGVAVCAAPEDQSFGKAAYCGFGGAIISWIDCRNGNNDIYAQGISSNGDLLWDAEGLPICANPGYQSGAGILNNNSNGMIMFWIDYRNVDADIYAQKLYINGDVEWAQDGIPICTAVEDQGAPVITTDEAGGAILAWEDERNGYKDIYAQRIKGFPGAPDCEISAIIYKISTAESLSISDTVLFGCPQGDGGLSLIIDLNFHDDDMEGIEIVDPQSITIDTTGLPYVFFEPNEADEPATSGNGYETTITRTNIGGCSECPSCASYYGFFILYDDVIIGRVDSLRVKSPDRTGDGGVGLSDIALLGETYNKDSDDPDYDDCFDFTGDKVVNLSDFIYFAEHYQHYYDGTGSQHVAKMNEESSTCVRIVTAIDGSKVQASKLYSTVFLEDVEDISIVTMSLAKESESLEWVGWVQNPDFPATALATPVRKHGEERVFIALLGMDSIECSNVEVGTMEYVLKDVDQLLEDKVELLLVFGEVLDSKGKIKKIKGIKYKQDEVPVYRNYLAVNYPNPFNPTTTIEYSVANDSHVNLSVYDVNGQLVRTLINGFKVKNNYRVIWDGKNNMGSDVASGVYFYRLKTDSFARARKLILLR